MKYTAIYYCPSKKFNSCPTRIHYHTEQTIEEIKAEHGKELRFIVEGHIKIVFSQGTNPIELLN